ncbi:MAG TPA: winged helix DNA-binding domain-containing protein, partial [Chitinophagaceae bacterium]
MTIKDIIKFRLHNQQITQHVFDEPGDLVKGFGAMQAQDYLNSLWAIGLRLKNTTENDIEKAIADKTIVRTWPMRRTLHFVSSGDVHWLLKLLTPRIISRSTTLYKQLGLDKNLFSKCKKLFVKALQGENQLTRNQLYDVLEKAKITTGAQRGLHILCHLAQEGLICFAARNGKQQTFALLDEWIPATKTLTHDEALAELARRYFASHAPATIHDFAWWSGLTVTEAKKSVEMINFYLQKEMIEGKSYYMAADMPVMKTKPGTVYLLPNFDEYLVAYKDRNAALDTKYAKQVIGAAGSNGIFSAVIIADGKIAGTWKRTLEKDNVTIDINP